MSEMKISNAEMKRLNKIKIVKYIYYHGGASKQELANELGFSMPTILQRVKELIADGILEETGEYESTGGRKAKALALVSDKQYAIGADITAHHVSFVALNLKGEVIYQKRIRCQFETNETYYREIAQYLEKFLDKGQIDRNRILGVGFSLPGIVDEANNTMKRSYILGLEKYDLEQMTQYIPYRTAFLNDASAAAYAELRGTNESCIYLSISNSVGGAIYVDGNINNGQNDCAGEFGHMILMPGGKTCHCGKKGCMDPYCNAKILHSNTGGDLERFFKELEEGNMQFVSIWREYLGYLAIAISNLRMAFDCDIILGGNVGGYMEQYSPLLEEYLEKYNIYDESFRFVRYTTKHKLQASAIGAGIRFIEDFLENIP